MTSLADGICPGDGSSGCFDNQNALFAYHAILFPVRTTSYLHTSVVDIVYTLVDIG